MIEEWLATGWGAAGLVVTSALGIYFTMVVLTRMDGERILHENLRKVKLTEADLRSKLCEANVLRPAQIRAVVMESTGDISVLHGEADGPELDRSLLEGVRGAVGRNAEDGPATDRAPARGPFRESTGA